MLRCLLSVCLFASALFAQHPVSPENMHHKVWAVLPLVGAGTAADPKRPLLIPTPAEQAAEAIPGERPDLLGYTMLLSDDGKFALVELTVGDPMAFDRILARALFKNPVFDNGSSRSIPSVATDGSNARNLTSNIAARKATLESSVPGLKLFERGKANPAEILSEFKRHKANFSFAMLGRAQ